MNYTQWWTREQAALIVVCWFVSLMFAQRVPVKFTEMIFPIKNVLCQERINHSAIWQQDP